MVILLSSHKTKITMGKSTHFSGQPLYSQVINLLDKAKFFKLVVNMAQNAILSASMAGLIY